MSPRHRNLVLGLILIAVGLIFLLETLGVAVLPHLWKAWPLVLVAFGAAKLWLHHAGAPTRTPAPERLLLWLVAAAGLVTTLGRPGKPSAESDRGPEAPPRTPEVPLGPPIREISTAFEASSRLRLDIDGADLDVAPGMEARVSASLSLTPGSSGDRLADAFASSVEAGELVVRFVRPAEAEGTRALVRVSAPAGTTVSIHARRGRIVVREMGELRLETAGSDVRLEAVSGRLTARIENGALLSSGLSAPAEIDARFAELELDATAGDVVVRSSASDVKLRQVAGNVELTASDALIRLEGIAGNTKLTAPRSRATVRGVGGELVVELSDGQLKAESIGGRLQVTTVNSPVSLSGARGGVVVTARDSAVVIGDVLGGVEVRSDGGGVSVRESRDGVVSVRAERGEVVLEGNLGAQTVVAKDGDVALNVRPAGPESPIELTVERGDVALRLGRGGARLALRAEDGRIRNLLEERLDLRQEGTTRSFTGLVRHEGQPIAVTVRQGTIRLSD